MVRDSDCSKSSLERKNIECDNKKMKIADEEKKYTIKFKMNSFEKIFYMDDDDTVDDLYKGIFADDLVPKLFYEDAKLSRLLTIDESGFFPGINYITSDAKPEYFGKKNIKLVIKFDEDITNDMVIEIDPESTIKSIIDLIPNRKTKFFLIRNGKLLNPNDKLDEIEDGDIIDVVGKNILNL